MKIIVVCVVWCIALNAALFYGGIWDMRAHPSQPVKVWFNDGRDLTGALSKDWNNSWVLKTGEHEEMHFRDSDHSAMTFPPSTNHVNFLSHWREAVAMGLVSAVFILFCLTSLRSRPIG